ncbi:LysM peptidoglycan-binding domain-containing protein [Paenibacillus camerounensis]|uniref:LysM peptidoglycan-binding domain-containing protein n=1 Tax=Paenibacillus camerounensis TaxID=1243663 RepID=UPI000693A3E9|nr:LysM peptidoglycan-binding domain-containing protein [Paenibacillus camerounensis]
MKIHIVKQGDTLYALSQKYGVPLQKIIEANPQISNPEALNVGDKVKIPAAPAPVAESSELFYKHTVKQGDTLWKLSKAWGITLKEIIDANPQLKNPNALMTGEIVNIPKKSNTTTIQPQSIQNNAVPIPADAVSPAVVDKTKVGGKTYTGPIEKPAKEMQTAPITDIVPEPVVNKAPEVNVAPEVNIAPVVNKAPEIAPVQMVHESQSLFVQISVPAQEAIVHEPKEKGKSAVEPAALAPVTKENHCNPAAGYPGLNENPYFYECPPVYPYHEQAMPLMGMNPAENMIQPAMFTNECITPYGYPGNMYPAAEAQGAWYPNMAPEYQAAPFTPVSPAMDYSPYGVPQYGGQPVNLPWPSCGCGGGAVIQPYGYEQPMYNGYQPYMPQQGAFSPYGVMGETLPGAGANSEAPLGAYSNPVLSGIPAYPVYPGMENTTHNRVPEILEPEPAVQEIPQAAAELKDTAAKAKARSGKTGGAKVKVSGNTEGKTAKAASRQGAGRSSRQGSSKKSKNPWISN